MSYARKSLANVLATIGITILSATLAVWQFYRFVTFRDALGVIDFQGGSLHLWLAVGAALTACVAAFFVFSVFLRYDRDDEMHITLSPNLQRSAAAEDEAFYE